MKKFTAVLLLTLSLLLALTGCSTGNNTTTTADTTKQTETAPLTDDTKGLETTKEDPIETDTAAITEDREGNPITLPESIDKIVSIGPSNTEILCALGLESKIIAVDSYSVGIEGIAAGLPTFDIMSSDPEQLIALDPDVVFVTGMAKADGEDPYKPLVDAGICMIYMPSSASIAAIQDDIRYIAQVTDAADKSLAIIQDMQDQIAAVKAIGDTISDKKAVYFEIASPPYLTTLGSDTFINEMIEIIGAKNVFADQVSYVSVSDEAILAANPEVILTSVDYVEDPVGDIMSRQGWDAITAIQNNAVYSVDADSSNRPSQNIVKALIEMAKAIYPEEYKDLK